MPAQRWKSPVLPLLQWHYLFQAITKLSPYLLPTWSSEENNGGNRKSPSLQWFCQIRALTFAKSERHWTEQSHSMPIRACLGWFSASQSDKMCFLACSLMVGRGDGGWWQIRSNRSQLCKKSMTHFKERKVVVRSFNLTTLELLSPEGAYGKQCCEHMMTWCDVSVP